MYGPSKTLLAHIHMIFASNLAPPSSYPFPRGLFKRVPVTLAGRRSQSARVTSRSVRANSGSLVCRSAPKLEPFDMVWLHRLACFVFVVCIRLGASCANLHWLTLVCISLLRFIYICIGWHWSMHWFCFGVGCIGLPGCWFVCVCVRVRCLLPYSHVLTLVGLLVEEIRSSVFGPDQRGDLFSGCWHIPRRCP